MTDFGRRHLIDEDFNQKYQVEKKNLIRAS
jgi:hypothetical protein